MSPQQKIDEYIQKTNDWRGEFIKEIRDIIHEVSPDIEEEWKWNSPVFSSKGKMVCSPSAFKSHVGLNFFNGAMIDDRAGLFNSGTEAKKSRSIQFTKDSKINKEALKSLIKIALEI
ncbi:MAG TPA: DUF1801 domain-containing protein [Saprospiraceae bacterium]|nr:DUF1801 domain-containing protein [Saprospiraceae bacterium]